MLQWSDKYSTVIKSEIKSSIFYKLEKYSTFLEKLEDIVMNFDEN